MTELKEGGLYKVVLASGAVDAFEEEGLSVCMNYWPDDGRPWKDERKLSYGTPFILLKAGKDGSYKVLIDDFIGWIEVWETIEELVEVKE